MIRVGMALALALTLTSCGDASTKQFGKDKPRVMWDAECKGWVVEHHMGNTFTVRRVTELDRDANCTASP